MSLRYQESREAMSIEDAFELYKYAAPILVFVTFMLPVFGVFSNPFVFNRLSNAYTHSLVIAKGAELSFEISFFFKDSGVHIADSPKIVKVAPAPEHDSTPLIVGIGVSVLMIPLSVWIYRMAASRGIERGEEKKLTANEELLQLIQNRTNRQYFWLSIEIIDVLSDLMNFLVFWTTPGNSLSSLQFVLFLSVALLSCPAGIFGSFMRVRIISSYSKISSADQKTLSVYAAALSSTSTTQISSSNLLIRLDMITMDLTVVDLALRGAILEDAPSVLINLFYSVLNGVDSSRPSSLAPLFAALISVFLIGRKTALLAKRFDLVSLKRSVESDLASSGGLEGEGGGVGRALSGALCTSVFGREGLATKVQKINSRASLAKANGIEEGAGEGSDQVVRAVSLDEQGIKKQMSSKSGKGDIEGAAPIADKIILRSARNLAAILPEAGGV